VLKHSATIDLFHVVKTFRDLSQVVLIQDMDLHQIRQMYEILYRLM